MFDIPPDVEVPPIYEALTNPRSLIAKSVEKLPNTDVIIELSRESSKTVFEPGTIAKVIVWYYGHIVCHGVSGMTEIEKYVAGSINTKSDKKILTIPLIDGKTYRITCNRITIQDYDIYCRTYGEFTPFRG